VNDTLRKRSSSKRGFVTVDADDAVTTLSTPSGSPASASNEASISIDSGVC